LKHDKLTRQNINRYDKFGLAPIHYAVHDIFSDSRFTALFHFISLSFEKNTADVSEEQKIRELLSSHPDPPLFWSILNAGGDINLPTKHDALTPLQIIGSYRISFFSFGV